MHIEPISTEIVCQIDERDHCQMLQEHYLHVYRLLAEYKLIPNAAFEKLNGNFHRCLCGVAIPYINGVIGCPEGVNWDTCIMEQISYFNEAKMPWVWQLDENSNSEFKQKLLEYGFQNEGVFRGVIGSLDNLILNPVVADGSTLQLVEDEATLKEFNDLVCTVFGIEGPGKQGYEKVMWDATKNPKYPMFHWVARKDGKVVSAVSTSIENEMVSFWNGASLPEIRRHGLSTALRQFALKHAISKGCRLGASYLMSEGMAFGICSKLGYQTKWRFNVFISPGINNETH